MHLTLLTRTYCHLCDEMEAQLRSLIGSTPLRVVDIDAPEHAALEARFGDGVPVLLLGAPEEGREVCRYRLDAAGLARALAGDAKIR